MVQYLARLVNLTDLTINGNAVLQGVVGVSDSSTSRIGALSVSGTSQIETDIFTSGTQTYSGNITLAGSDPLINLNASDIILNNMASINGAEALEIDSANPFDLYNVGNTTALTSLHIDNGNVDLNGNISTTGSQAYDGNVVVDDNTTSN